LGFHEQVCKWNWFTANGLNATLGDRVFCVSVTDTNMLGESKLHFFTPDISQMFPVPTQTSCLHLSYAQLKSTAMSFMVKYSKVFTFFT